MTYAEKLRDPRWQKKRLQILERDQWTCQCCLSTTKNLQVHHLYYAKKDPWDYPDHVYQTLCDDCHKERQAIVDEYVAKMRVTSAGIKTKDLTIALLRALGVLGEYREKSQPVDAQTAKKYFAAMRENLKGEK